MDPVVELYIVSCPHPYVGGLGLDCDEAMYGGPPVPDIA